MPCQFKRWIRYTTLLGEVRGMYVPCGKCLDCRRRISSEWQFRLNQEVKLHKHSFFVTLTYDSKNLPKGSNLNYRDVQLFFHRLRHHFKFRYFCIGEYGWNGTNRPHYHIILFPTSNPHLCTSRLLAEVWNKGFVRVDPVTSGRIKYVASYGSLGNCASRSVRPFRHMSLRSPIGYNFLGSYSFENCVKTDNWSIVVDRRNGEPRRIIVPRYYRRWAINHGYVSTREYVDDYKIPTDVIEINLEGYFKTKDYKGSKRYTVPKQYYDRSYRDYCMFVNKKSHLPSEKNISVPYEVWLASFLPKFSFSKIY